MFSIKYCGLLANQGLLMSSSEDLTSEDLKGGEPPDKPEPPDLNLDSSTGPFNEPNTQAHSVSQPQGVTSDPVSPDNAEHDKTESADVETTVEAHGTMSQASDVSSIDPFELPLELRSTEGQQGEAEPEGSAVDPETEEIVQPPISTAVQTPATTTPSNPSPIANTTATTTTTQSVAITTTSSNIQSTIAIIHQASEPVKEANPAIPVPGLTNLGSEEQEAEQQAHVSPEMVVQTSIEDLFTAHSMSHLQLRDDTASDADPKPENVTPGGPGPSSDSQNPATQQPLSSTPARPLTEPQNNLNVSATASSEQLGSTIHAAHDSTTSLTGFDSASNIFLGETSSSVPAVQSTDPNPSESIADPDMEQDPSREGEDAMDTTHQSAYTQHAANTGSVVQPGTDNVSSTDADQAVRLMTQLFQAQQAGNLADVTSQLQGAQAQQLTQILQLAKAVGQPTRVDPDTSSAHLDTATDSDADSTMESDSGSESVTTDASDQNRRRKATRKRIASSQAQQLLDQSGNDVILIDEQVETEGLDNIRLIQGWDTDFKLEEQSWPTRFPIRKPFIKPQVEQVDDNWYQGEDCLDPSRIAAPAERAILPSADGALALKRDVDMPGASRGRTKYKTHDLERRMAYKRGKCVEGKLMQIASAELIRHDQEHKRLLAADEFWQKEIRDSLYVPGPDDTPVNFAYRSGLGRIEAIPYPYRVAAPMAWEYPYAYGQLQESLTDRLVPASLYGIQLVRPGYYSPQAGPSPYSASEWQERKSRACANYVLDTDSSACADDYSPPQGSIGTASNGEEAFTCREEGC